MPEPDSSQVPGDERGPELGRYELQSVLGQIHGLVDTAIQHPWYPDELAEPIRAGYPGISQAFGRVQAELNTGEHDEDLLARGLAGEQMEPKKLGFRAALRRFLTTLRQTVQEGSANYLTDLVAPARELGDALQWASVIVGSLAAELNKVRGVEIIKEGIEVIQVAVAQWVARRPAGDAPAPRRASREEEPAKRPAEDDQESRGRRRREGGPASE
jgi:hypothetical protein